MKDNCFNIYYNSRLDTWELYESSGHAILGWSRSQDQVVWFAKNAAQRNNGGEPVEFDIERYGAVVYMSPKPTSAIWQEIVDREDAEWKRKVDEMIAGYVPGSLLDPTKVWSTEPDLLQLMHDL